MSLEVVSGVNKVIEVVNNITNSETRRTNEFILSQATKLEFHIEIDSSKPTLIGSTPNYYVIE